VIDVNPLVATPPPEVPLINAPLVRVIAQVRFPPILSIEQQAFVGSFQEAIRAEYPKYCMSHYFYYQKLKYPLDGA
jgi:hypothetical protein